ncbi:hypothetical protein E0485_19435 [Paenibacillus albiflavus]|uniref:Copper resistance protein D domain-containing protein n=1 Tax=Paenibacillus albiflavus TaxID=2545760 RepID=A0A4R4E9Z8_9BACL|nr:CopD family protein [Paenibacillus albiflavus]TCZ74635.1 hypothetical protein E0485_19435 [Paenibacillus albiflavus]
MSLHQFSADMSTSLLFQFASRGLWYLIVLILAGGLLWTAFFKTGDTARASIARVTSNLQLFQLFALVLMILTHLEELLDGGGMDELANIFLTTNVGIGWLVLLVLSIIGIVALARIPWLNVIWAIAFLLVSSMYGHSATDNPAWITMLLGFIHLACAALLLGGLLFGLYIRRRQADRFATWIHNYVRIAITSILVMTITGIISTLILLPSMDYLLRTQWGILLLVKAGLTLIMLVLLIMVWAKERRRQNQSVAGLLKLNVTLGVVITLIVGCITYMSPTPTNKPLFWHEMGETVHMSVRVNPLFVGPNTFRAKIWASEKEEAPAKVVMQLYSLDRQNEAPIEIALSPYKDNKKEADFEGFKEYDYQAEDQKLPYSGNWKLEVHVKRSTGDEVKYEKTFKLN